MHTENAIVMHAPFERIFATAGDLSLWPKILPHYRFITYLEKSKDRNVVRMAARRGRIPVSWVSEQVIDRERHEVRFLHLRALTKGMVVVWTFTRVEEGVLVRIRHDLNPRIPVIGRFLTERIIGRFFIAHIATQTLAHMKRYVELTYGA